jgi:hypothetical protein
MNHHLIWGTLRSRSRTGVDFDKSCMFCGKCCVCIDKCVFIVGKIKCVNSDRINNICDKVNFITNYTHFTTPNIHVIKTHINIIIFNTFNTGRSHSRDKDPLHLEISPFVNGDSPFYFKWRGSLSP